MTGRYSFFILAIVMVGAFTATAQPRNSKSVSAETYAAYPFNIAEQLKVFHTDKMASVFRISLCADVPNNKKPLQVAHNQ